MKLTDVLRAGLEELMKNHVKVDKEYALERQCAFWEVTDDVFIGVTEDGMKKIGVLVEEVFRLRRKSRKFLSDEFVEKEILDSLKYLLRHTDNDGYNHEVERLIEAFTKCYSEWLVVVPVDNLRVDSLVKLGRASIYPGTEDSINEFAERMRTDRTHLTLFLGDHLRNRHALPRNLFSYALIECTAGEKDMALRRALITLDAELSIIRLLAPSPMFGISGSYSIGERSAVMHCKGTGSVTSKASIVGASIPFNMSSKSITALSSDRSLQRICEACRKSDSVQSDLEKRMILALTWYGRSTIVSDQREVMIDAMIGFEALLLGDHEPAKRETIAERAALLLGRTLSEKLNIYSRLDKVGDTRNKITHSGLLEVSYAEANDSVSILRFAIIEYAHVLDKVSDFAALKSHFLKLKFEPCVSSGSTDAGK